jgi:hypothetical protein
VGKKAAGLVVVAAAVVGGATVYVSLEKKPDGLSVGLLQAFTLLLSISGAYVFGKNAAREAAQDVLAPHARSSFRRVRNLYSALQRFAESIVVRRDVLEKIAAENDGLVAVEHVRAAMDLLGTQVFEQIGTADDALEDWRDIVPDEIAALETEAARRGGESLG